MKYQIIVAALAAVLMAGCQTSRVQNLGSPAQLEFPAVSVQMISDPNDPSRKIAQWKMDVDQQQPSLRLEFLERALQLDSADGPREIAGYLIAESDRICDQHMARANQTRNTLTTSLGALAILTGAAATVPTGGQTANILSAIGTGSLGTSQTYERNFFNERGAEIVIRALNSERARLKDEIVKRLQGSHYNNLPSTMLLADVEAYHAHCGITVALSDLEDDAGGEPDRRSVEERVSAAQMAWCNQARAAGLTDAADLPVCSTDDDGT
ncbi:MAG: hypothetical protein AAFY34_15720 [Pseudomonadota bacterium]